MRLVNSSSGVRLFSYLEQGFLILGDITSTQTLGFTYSLRKYDRIFEDYLDRITPFPETWVNIEPNILGDDELDVRHFQPQHSEYVYDVDRRRYANILSLVGHAFAVLSPLGSTERKRENIVAHSSTSGEGFTDAYISYIQSESDNQIGGQNYRRNEYRSFQTEYDGNRYPTGSATSSTWHNHVKREDLSSYLAGVREAIVGTQISYYTDGKPSLATVKAFEYDVTETSLTIWYKQRIRRHHTNNNYWTEFTLDTRLECFPAAIYIDVGYGDRWYLGNIHVTDTFSDYDKSPNITWADYAADTPTLTYRQYIGSFPCGRNENYVEVLDSVDSEIQALRREHFRVASHLDKIYPSAYVSSGIAIRDSMELVNSNYLESLSEITQIWALLPDTEPIKKFLQVLPLGKVISGLVSFVDILTNSYLLYKFGLEPLKNDLENVGVLLDKKLEHLQRLSSPVTIYGKHTYTFDPEDETFGGYTLVTRTKIRIKYPPESLVMAILPLSSSGLDPSPKNLWDLLPFSFVVDWFTNMSTRIEIGQSALYAMSSQIDLCVHSYTLYKATEDIDGTQFEYDDSQFKFYLRDVSIFYPYPKNHTYDFLDQTNVPLLSGSAVLWTFIRNLG